MALTAKFGLETRRSDAVSAFANSPLDEEFFVDWPPGYENDSDGHQCLRLLEALSGLRRSPIPWFGSLSSAFVRLDLQAVPEGARTFSNDGIGISFAFFGR